MSKFAKFSLALFETPAVDVGRGVVSAGKAPVVVAVVVLDDATGAGGGLLSSSLLVVLALPEITLPVDVVPPAEIYAPVASSTRLPFT